MKQLDMKTKIDTVYRFAFAHSVDGTSDCYLFGCIAYKTWECDFLLPIHV